MLGYRFGAYIVCNMTVKASGIQTKVAQRQRYSAAGVIAGRHGGCESTLSVSASERPAVRVREKGCTLSRRRRLLYKAAAGGRRNHTAITGTANRRW